MYIDLSAKESSESREVSPGVVLDYDDENKLVGIDIDNASSKMDLKELILSKLPTEKQTIAAWSLNMRKSDNQVFDLFNHSPLTWWFGVPWWDYASFHNQGLMPEPPKW